MHEETKRSISGHLRVEERAGGERKWIATYVTHKGPRTRTLIGPAWVRDTGRRTQRGGKIWRAGDGTCPDARADRSEPSPADHAASAPGPRLEFAVARGWLTDNPAQTVDLPAPPRPHADFNVLEPSRVEAVARAVQQLPDFDVPVMRNGEAAAHTRAIMQRRRALYADAVRFSAYTGVRVGELRALRWRDIDFTGQTLRICRNNPSSLPAGHADQAPKSGKGRSVPMTPAAVAALERISQIGYATGAEDHVFATEGDGPVDGAKLRDALYRGLEAAGLGYLRTKANPMRWHDLRHTFGTMAVRVFPLTDVQAYMGHSNIQTTMRYVHHAPRGDAAAKLAQVFEQDLNPIPFPTQSPDPDTAEPATSAQNETPTSRSGRCHSARWSAAGGGSALLGR